MRPQLLIAATALALFAVPSAAQSDAVDVFEAQIAAQAVLVSSPVVSFDQEQEPVLGERSGVLAGVLSAFVWPGVGSYYAGNSGHGTRHLLIGVGTAGMMLGGLLAACDDGLSWCATDHAGYYVASAGAIGYLVNWVWSIFTATGDVSDYNRRLREQQAGG
jgi:hypothetical protein